MTTRLLKSERTQTERTTATWANSLMESSYNNRLVIFSTSPQEREHLRNRLAAADASVFCFSSEGACFENLESIRPDIVIARSDSLMTAWRFIFVMHTLNAGVPLAIASDRLRNESFALNGLNLPVHFVPLAGYGEQFYHVLDTIRNATRDARQANRRPLLVGESAFIRKIRLDLPRLANSRETVLISGERGTGKELLSRLIAAERDPLQSLIKINCTDLKTPDISLEGTVYGSLLHTAGDGRFNELSLRPGVTISILLDRVDTLYDCTPSQLMFLMEEIPNRLNGSVPGSAHPIRFIATCENDLERNADKGMFRQDVYHRLNVIPIRIPPLRHRKEDIPLIVDYFMSNACIKNKKSFHIMSPDVIERMYYHDWPGNIDELRTAVERIVFTGDDTFLPAPTLNRGSDHSPSAELLKAFDVDAAANLGAIKRALPDMKRLSLKSVCGRFVVRIEKKLLRKALESTQWNRKKAAEMLNISYKSMLNKLKEYNLV